MSLQSSQTTYKETDDPRINALIDAEYDIWQQKMKVLNDEVQKILGPDAWVSCKVDIGIVVIEEENYGN